MKTDITDRAFFLGQGETLTPINENLSLIQKTGGLTFGTDAYLLAAFARAVPAGTVCDLGSGTGVASLLCLSRKKFRRACAVEIQEEFCDLIARNAELNGMSGHVSVIRKDVRDLTLTDTSGEADAVISNPPYLAAGSGFSSADSRMEIARRELHGGITDFCKAAARLLKTGGAFYTVFRPDRMPELISALRDARLEPKRLITVYPDAESRPCLILVESKKDAAPSLLYAPPLLIYRSKTDRSYTDVMARVYDTFSLEFLFETRKGAAL